MPCRPRCSSTRRTSSSRRPPAASRSFAPGRGISARSCRSGTRSPASSTRAARIKWPATWCSSNPFCTLFSRCTVSSANLAVAIQAILLRVRNDTSATSRQASPSCTGATGRSVFLNESNGGSLVPPCSNMLMAQAFGTAAGVANGLLNICFRIQF